MDIIETKLKKYFKLIEEAFKKIKIVEKGSLDFKRAAEDILDLAQRYYKDAKHFKTKGDLVNAFGAVCYAHAFLDIGARLGLFDVGKDSRLFMVD